MDGILNIDKPAGMTSYGVVARIKRLSGEKRVGHAGTLDPDATGVLPVCLGKATRVVEYLSDASKTYRAVIELGIATDTYDASGNIIQRGDASGISLGELEQAMASFRGTISQVPPMYSALKHEGQPLYKLARAGISIERNSRDVNVYRLEITGWQPPEATLEIECSKGTYIRSLAHDLGQALGCGAHLKTLVRTAYGPFQIGSAVSLAQLKEAFGEGRGDSFILPVDYVLRSFRPAFLDEDTEKAMRQGKLLTLEQTMPVEDNADTRCRAYGMDGSFLGILRYIPESGLWHPEKVFV